MLPENPRPPANGAAVPGAENHLVAGPDPAAESGPATRWPIVRTSRMEILSRQALELIEGEEIRLRDELAVLKREYARFLALRDALADEVAVLEEKLKEARSRLSEQELEDRRLAERHVQDRPVGLVRARRQTGWERRLGTAEQQYQSATARLADAKHEAQLREELIRDRGAVARAAARRHYELALRRTATYQQQLVRTHRRGPELNRLLLDHLVGPDLPAWARDPAADESGTGPDGP